jgi:hypothetical protein
MWTEVVSAESVHPFREHADTILDAPQPKSKNRKPVNKDRFIPKMFLRGDSVVLGEQTGERRVRCV